MSLINTYKKLAYLVTGAAPEEFSIIKANCGMETVYQGNMAVANVVSAAIIAEQLDAESDTWQIKARSLGRTTRGKEDIIQSGSRLEIFERMAGFHETNQTVAPTTAVGRWYTNLTAPLASVLYAGEKVKAVAQPTLQ